VDGEDSGFHSGASNMSLRVKNNYMYSGLCEIKMNSEKKDNIGRVKKKKKRKILGESRVEENYF